MNNYENFLFIFFFNLWCEFPPSHSGKVFTPTLACHSHEAKHQRVFLVQEFSTMPPYHDEFVIHCHSWEAAVVNRDGKWGVSALQYPLDSYPDYCSGFLVLLKLPAVEELYYVGTTEYCISGTTVLYNQYNNVLYYRCLGLSRQCQSSTAQVILTST